MAAEVRVYPTTDEFWILLSMLRVKVLFGSTVDPKQPALFK